MDRKVKLPTVPKAKLKPCPFCGGEAELRHETANQGYSYVECKSCGLRAVKFPRSFETASDVLATDYWNRRVNDG